MYTEFALGVTVSILIARHLGPEMFGASRRPICARDAVPLLSGAMLRQRSSAAFSSPIRPVFGTHAVRRAVFGAPSIRSPFGMNPRPRKLKATLNTWSPKFSAHANQSYAFMNIEFRAVDTARRHPLRPATSC